MPIATIIDNNGQCNIKKNIFRIIKEKSIAFNNYSQVDIISCIALRKSYKAAKTKMSDRGRGRGERGRFQGKSNAESSKIPNKEC